MEVMEIKGAPPLKFTMRLNMATCFPCTVTWLRQLLKRAVDVSDNPELHRAELVIHLNELYDKIDDEIMLKKLANKAVDYKEVGDRKQVSIDAKLKEIEYLKDWIDRNLGNKQPKHEARARLKMKKDELKALKESQRYAYGKSRAARDMFDTIQRDKKNLLKCLEILGQGGETDAAI